MGKHFASKHAAETHLGNRGFAPGSDNQWNKFYEAVDCMLWAQVTVYADGTSFVFFWEETD